MEKKELDFIDKAVMRYLRWDKDRAKRIIEAAFPKHNLSRNPIRKKQEGEAVNAQ